jgi:hypothetical protein
MADMLVIDSVADILLNTAPWPVFDIAASAISYPFRYSTRRFMLARFGNPLACSPQCRVMLGNTPLCTTISLCFSSSRLRAFTSPAMCEASAIDARSS